MPRIVRDIPERSVYRDSFEFVTNMLPGETARFVRGEDFNTDAQTFNSSIRNYIRANKINAFTRVRGDELYVTRNS